MSKSDQDRRFDVYDRVWIMRGNKPQEMYVFAVIESMDFRKTGTELHYHLVEGRVGAGWGNNEGLRVAEHDVFATKQDMLGEL